MFKAKIKDTCLQKLKELHKYKEKFQKERLCVGIDLGSAAIKMVALKAAKGNIECCKAEVSPIQVNISPLITKFVNPLRIKKINISVSGPGTIIRYVSFPKMSESELKNALKFEAQKHIPFLLEDVFLDCHIVNPAIPDNKMLVLLVAAKKELINQQVKFVEGLGLRVQIIDMVSTSLINAFTYNYLQNGSALKEKSIALLNIGATETNLNILESCVPALSRDIHIAGNVFSKRLADVFNVDISAAEEMKCSITEDKQEKVLSSIESVVVNLASEIRSSFDYYESQTASSVEKIFLSGGGSLLPGLQKALVRLVGIDVEVWDPFKNISFSPSAQNQQNRARASQLAVALGLALRN